MINSSHCDLRPQLVHGDCKLSWWVLQGSQVLGKWSLLTLRNIPVNAQDYAPLWWMFTFYWIAFSDQIIKKKSEYNFGENTPWKYIWLERKFFLKKSLLTFSSREPAGNWELSEWFSWLFHTSLVCSDVLEVKLWTKWKASSPHTQTPAKLVTGMRISYLGVWKRICRADSLRTNKQSCCESSEDQDRGILSCCRLGLGTKVLHPEKKQ